MKGTTMRMRAFSRSLGLLVLSAAAVGSAINSLNERSERIGRSALMKTPVGIGSLDTGSATAYP